MKQDGNQDISFVIIEERSCKNDISIEITPRLLELKKVRGYQ